MLHDSLFIGNIIIERDGTFNVFFKVALKNQAAAENIKLIIRNVPEFYFEVFSGIFKNVFKPFRIIECDIGKWYACRFYFVSGKACGEKICKKKSDEVFVLLQKIGILKALFKLFKISGALNQGLCIVGSVFQSVIIPDMFQNIQIFFE
jgi:hypothetical protein